MLFKNKVLLVILTIVPIGLFVFGVPFVLASECGKSQSVYSFFDSLLSLAEKTIKGFGYEAVLASAPDPDNCGSDVVGSCPNISATIKWEAAPTKNCSDEFNGTWSVPPTYTLTIDGGIGDVSTSDTSYTTSATLNPNTTYHWSVNAFYNDIVYNLCSYLNPSFLNTPYGSFTTPTCETLTVDLTATPISGSAPLGVDFDGILGGTALGNINYYFWWNCSDTTTDVSQAESSCGALSKLPGWMHGQGCAWDDVGGRCLAVAPSLDNFTYHYYNDVGVYQAKIIAERGVAGPTQDQTTITAVAVSNQAPTASGLSVSEDSSATYCGGAYHDFSWLYSDPDGNPESRFQFQVDLDNDPNNGAIVDRDFTGLSNPSLWPNNQVVLVTDSAAPDKLVYGATYYWRVKVYDSQGASSGWMSGASFTTASHRYPSISFNWMPLASIADEDTLFADQSTVYDGRGVASGWLWRFDPDGSPNSSAQQNPTIQFASSGDKQVSLTATDSTGYSCSDTETVSVGWALPDWREILPW